MVKQRKMTLISITLTLMLLILIALFRSYFISSAKVTYIQVAPNLCSYQVTWNEHITCEMLSEDIQAFISQEEFENNGYTRTINFN